MRAKAFQAQALDNSSADHLRLAENAAELQGPLREQTYSRMSHISAQGTVLFAREGIKLTANGDAAILQIVAEELDHAGRFAPLACWVELDTKQGSGTNGIDVVWRSFEQFASAIGRSFPNSKRLAAREALELFEKKQPSQSSIALAIAYLQREMGAWLKHLLAIFNRFQK